MGLQPYHLTGKDIKARLSGCGDIGSLDTDVIEETYLIVAERMLDEEFRLSLDSIGYPDRWVGYFDNATDGEIRRSEFLQDFNISIYALVQRLALNPHDLISERTGRVSASFGPKIPTVCHSMLRRWGQPNLIYRA